MQLRPVPIAALVMVCLQVVPHSASGDRPPENIAGEAQVVDGNTLIVEGLTIRLWGIDAPDKDQTCREADGEPWACGEEAARALEGFIDGRQVICGMSHLQIGQHIIADCTRGDADVGAWLVRNGWALDRPRHSDGHYAEDQNAARSNGAGLWRGPFEVPWRWRGNVAH